MSTVDLNARSYAEAKLDDAIARALDAGDVPAHVQERLDRTYASLGKIPQERIAHRGGKRLGKGAAALGVAAACALFAGAAFAAGNLISMGQGDAAFFAHDKNLPVFNSMEPGARALSADVGQSGMVDGIEVTVDSISCDRSVANLFMTLHKEEGFSMEELAHYDGSKEAEWAKLQNAVPHLEYQVNGSDGSSASGSVRSLDAYMEGEDIKCLMRVTPAALMSEQVQISLNAWSQDYGASVPLASVGLDLSAVPAPKSAGRQELAFATAQGEKRLDLVRFTVSELATVMVVQPAVANWIDDEGRVVEGLQEGTMDAGMLMVKDQAGNVLSFVDPGDGEGRSADEPYAIEFAGFDVGADEVMLIPVLEDEAAMDADVAARAASVAAGDIQQDDRFDLDVSQIGTKIPLTELGGYEIESWDVSGSCVAIGMKPYGWVPVGSVPELIADADVTALVDAWTDPDTGQTGEGSHSAIRYLKWDYATGEVVQIDSYYAATQEELEQVTKYYTHIYPSGWYRPDEAAAVTLSLS